MGNYCKFYYFNISGEDFIKDILTTSCLLNLNYKDLDRIIKKNTNIIYLEKNNKNYVMSDDSFYTICKNIFGKLYFKGKDNRKNIIDIDFYDQDLVKKFLYGLYNLIKINNKLDQSIFCLIMLPFNFNEKDLPDNKKYQIFFNALKIINFSIDENQNSINNESITYSMFLENFNLYLALTLSGFTKIIYENLHENNSEEIIRKEILYNLQNYFIPDNINNFYMKISQNLRNKVEMKKNEEKLSTINEVEITFAMFNVFCNENKFIINYFELRKEFISFAKELKEKEKKNII
jgi:hypothetical protein